MNKKQDNPTMERIYRVLSYVAVGVCGFLVWGIFGIILAFPLAFALDSCGFPEWLKIMLCVIAGLVCYVGIFYLFWRCFMKPDRQSEYNELSRMQSCGLWGMAAVLAASAVMFCSWYLMSNGLNLIGLCAVLLAVSTGTFFPFKRHLNGGVFGSGGLIAALLIFMLLGMILARAGRSLN